MKNVLILSILFITSNICAQDSLTHALGNYLVAKDEIDSAVYFTQGKGKKMNIVTNFFVDKLISMDLDSGELSFYKFGSYREHTNPHLIVILNGQFDKKAVLDGKDIERDFNFLFFFFKTITTDERQLRRLRINVLSAYLSAIKNIN